MRSSLTEMARPLMAMACEELARALARAFSKQDSAQALSSTVRANAAQPAHWSGEPPTGRDNQQARNAHKSSATPDMHGARQNNAVQADDEEVCHPMEVQPLFDPKLPPSANSEFKPMIGVVAARLRASLSLFATTSRVSLKALAVGRFENQSADPGLSSSGHIQTASCGLLDNAHLRHEFPLLRHPEVIL